MHQNVQCISNKVLALEVILNESQPDIVMFTEHWQNCDQLSELNFKNYDLASSYCRQSMLHGGACILTNNKLSECVKPIYCKTLSFEGNFEFCCIKLLKLSTIFITVYRPPSGDVNIF